MGSANEILVQVTYLPSQKRSHVTSCIDDKIPVDTIYLDLAKAFDKVPHECLVLTLKVRGINGLVCNWIKA